MKNNKDITIKALRKVLKLIKAGWTKGALARNKYGHKVSLDSPNACKFCLSGAIAKTATNFMISYRLYNVVQNESPEDMSFFNDAKTTKKPDVIAVVQRAIDKLAK